MSISAVITVVSGEEKYLPACLSSIKNLADEIVIVDMSSAKEVSEIAKTYKAKVFKHEFVNYVEPVRNFALRQAQGQWVLVLDPDEEVTSDLKNKLKEISQKEDIHYARLPRKNMIFDKWMEHSRWWPDYNIRFFKKGYVQWGDEIHSIPVTTGVGVDLEAQEELAIKHNHYQTIPPLCLTKASAVQ